MKIMLTGASGLLGRSIYTEMQPKFELLACAFSRSGKTFHKIDLTDKQAVLTQVEDFQPDIIIHSAAERSPDICENDHSRTLQLNVDACNHLVQAAIKQKCPIIYISTDYVFDGSQAPYAPQDTPNPLNFYGKSKLLGEEAIAQGLEHYAIFRVPVLYGHVENLAESAITALLNPVISDTTTLQDHWAARYPTYVGDIADALVKLAPKLKENPKLSGIYHFSGNERMTKYEICQSMASILKKDSEKIQPNSQEPKGAPRPQDCHLDDSKLDAIIPLRKTPFATAIQHIIAKLQDSGIL